MCRGPASISLCSLRVGLISTLPCHNRLCPDCDHNKPSVPSGVCHHSEKGLTIAYCHVIAFQCFSVQLEIFYTLKMGPYYIPYAHTMQLDAVLVNIINALHYFNSFRMCILWLAYSQSEIAISLLENSPPPQICPYYQNQRISLLIFKYQGGICKYFFRINSYEQYFRRKQTNFAILKVPFNLLGKLTKTLLPEVQQRPHCTPAESSTYPQCEESYPGSPENLVPGLCSATAVCCIDGCQSKHSTPPQILWEMSWFPT